MSELFQTPSIWHSLRNLTSLDFIPPPHSRVSLSVQSFFHLFLPPLLLYYLSAVLVQLRRTFILRLALLPICLWTVYRVNTRLDLAAAYDDDRLIYLNQGLLLAMSTLAFRVIGWTFQSIPYRNLRSQSKSSVPSSSVDDTLTVKQAAWDAFDLMFNLRGCGWNWCKGLYLPQETRPVSSKPAFIIATFTSFISHLVLGDVIHYTVQWFSPSTIGSAAGGTIFDQSLPPVTRYLRSTLITFLAGMTVYSAIQTVYDGISLIGMIFLGQDPSQWPPLFDAPWCATSLAEFWAKRWHQLFRDNFISVGAKPFTVLAGRAGGVIGAFYVSGLMHDLGMWGMGRGADFRRVGGYFVVNGFGILLEIGWRKLSGKKVKGVLGWIWTMLWVICWGNMLIDAWCSRGLAGSKFFPQSFRPTDHIFGPL